MTYKEIINRIRAVVEDHLILKDFGYGQLSDLKTQSQLGPEEQGVDYPYLFLLPQTHQRQGPVMNYTFNMIVMDMARGEEGDLYDNYITIQSQCQQYIDDVLANLYYYYKDQPEVQLTGISYVPFKEKYQDELAGMTATITIQVPTPLNECIAPYAPDYDFIVQRRTAPIDHPMDFDGLPPPDLGSDQWNYLQWSYDGITWVQAPGNIGGLSYNRFLPAETAVYKIEFNNICKFNEPEDGSGILKYFIKLIPVPSPAIWSSASINQEWVSNDTVVEVNGTFIGELQAGVNYYFYAGQDYAVPPTSDIGNQLVNSTVKAYKLIE